MSSATKIVVVFALILVLSRFRVRLGLALVAGGIALDLWAEVPPPDVLSHLLGSLRSVQMWLLLAVTVLIIEIGQYMTEDKNAEEILKMFG